MGVGFLARDFLARGVSRRVVRWRGGNWFVGIGVGSFLLIVEGVGWAIGVGSFLVGGVVFVWARRIVSERFFFFTWVLGRVKRLDGVFVFAGQGVFWWWGGFVVVVVGAFVLVRAFWGSCF